MSSPAAMYGPAIPHAPRKGSDASIGSAASAVSNLTTSSTSSKGVQFSKFVKVSYTFGQEEYDRNPIEVDEMSSHDYYEFYQMQYQMYQTMKAEITLRQLGMLDVAMPQFDQDQVDRPEDYFLSSRTGAAPTNIPQEPVQVQQAPSPMETAATVATGHQYQIHPDISAVSGFPQEQLSVH